ncbi:MAG: MBOAT family protein [Bacteroidota bacterium]|nr:MBOAT family protein [Bacteroidota bacterium]
MVFSSSIFLTRFLPLLLLVYFLADKKYRNNILLAASIIFYSWKAPRFIFMILATTLVDFFLVKRMFEEKDRRKKKLILIISLCVNIGLLFYFKYCGFFVENINELITSLGGSPMPWMEIVMPIGISFYTFESMTYVIDVYRGVHEPQKKFSSYLLYIIFFPKLIAGPIVRYHQLADQLVSREENNGERLLGFIRFCTGLAKKVLIANYLGQYATIVFGTFDQTVPGLDPLTLHASTAWIGALAFTFQIYFDFAGYSDMAIGLARMFGFRLPENFNSPYLAESITDFWRRWHITLGAWMKNYLYIPLGGNKVSAKRIYLNLFIVFLVSGFWHGASWNFILWGCWHGFFLVIERLFLLKLYEKVYRPIRILVTLFFVMLGWIIFAVKDVSKGITYIKALFGNGNATDNVRMSPELLTFFLVAVFFSFFAYWKKTYDFSQRWHGGRFEKTFALPLTVICVLLLFILSLSYVTSEGFNPFIYFRF